MSSFPTSFSRSPSYLVALRNLSHINSTGSALGRVNQQLATGLDILRPSDDPVRSATISVLDARIETTNQLISNLQFADSTTGTLDQALGDAKSLIDEALSLASSQISSDPETRESQAIIVDSLISSLYAISNQDSLAGYIFGGTAPGRQPIVYDSGAYRFVGETGGLTAALGAASDVPITMGIGNAIGELSNRVQGVGDLDPSLTLETLISDLNGATNDGIELGSIQFSFSGGPTASVDLTGAVTVGDIADKLTNAIQQYETDNAVTILGPGGISVSGGALSLDIPSGDLTFSDVFGADYGERLGLVSSTPTPFNAGNALGGDLDPNLAWTTPVAALNGAGGPLGSIVVTNNGQRSTIDLSGAETLADVRALIEAGSTGVRLELDENGRSLNLITESAGTQAQALSVSQVTGDDTAERLGIRSFADYTRISDFNDGTGVEVISGRTDPTTGLVDPSLNTDFIITLGDGFEISIDLSPSDMVNVGTVVNAIENQADAQLTAAGRPITDFTASVSPTENGFLFTQTAALGLSGSLSVSPRNNSTAADQLGLLDSKPSGTTALRSEDRATVRVNNMFSHLLDLAEALRQNDTSGIEVAASRLESSQETLIQARALAGGYASRISTELTRQEDRVVFDEAVRSQLRDLDYAAASTQYAQLQLQLQAGLSVTAQAQQLTLLDFLG